MKAMVDTIKNHAFKIQIGTALAVIFFIIGSVWWFSGEMSELRHDIESNQKDITMINEIAKENSKSAIEIKVKLSSIEAQLAGISTTLLEIKKNTSE